MENKSCTQCELGCNKLFTANDLTLLDSNKSNLDFEPGEVIIKQGGLVSNILKLHQGLVKIVLEDRNDKNTILGIANEGDFIALPALGQINKYPYSIVALTRVNVCQIRRETMLDIMQQNASVNNFLTNWFSKQIIELGQKVNVLSNRNNHGKLATTLLYLYENFNQYQIFEKITRKELAEFASISLESANKILLQLKNDKIIDMNNKNLIILQPELIKRLSTIG